MNGGMLTRRFQCELHFCVRNQVHLEGEKIMQTDYKISQLTRNKATDISKFLILACM